MTRHAFPISMHRTVHHRFCIVGTQGALHVSAQAVLHASWTVLFGPSGSGKSTILRALTSVLPNLDVDFARRNPDGSTWQTLSSAGSHTSIPAARRALAYSPQQAQLLPHLTAEANILFPEQIRRIASTHSALPELTDLLHLAPLLPRLPHQLSAGERQRIALARALAVPGARLLLLDEPFAGVDRAQRDHLLPALREYLQRRDLAVLSVTHDPDEVLLLGADVLRMKEGRLVAHGAPDVTLADELERLRTVLQSQNPS